MLEAVVKTFLASVGALVMFMFGGWSAVLGILMAFVILDYITGLMAAYVNGELKSEIGLRGIAKKVFIFAMVSMGHLIDLALGNEPLVFSAVAFFYIANEVISIIENAGKAGIPVPEQLKNSIQILKGRGDSSNGKNH